MKLRERRLILLILCITATGALLFTPGLPWSPQCRHFFKKIFTRADVTVAAWQGAPAELISLKGKIVGKNGALSGAEVEALDSISGWAGLTDERGAFSLLDVLWYPGAAYTLVVAANDYQSRSLNVRAPINRPPGGVLDVGDLDFDSGCRVDLATLPGRNSITAIAYDEINSSYYRTLFDKLTEGKTHDEEIMGVISRYVSEKLMTPGAGGGSIRRQVDSTSPREVLEHGSRYCGQLAVALATIAEAGNYQTRVLDLIDPTEWPPTTHMVAEVFYGDRWHLYDPFLEGASGRRNGRVASYTELRLDPDLRLPGPLRDHLPGSGDGPNWVDLYRTGLHHYYYVERR